MSMIPEEDENINHVNMMEEEEVETSKVDYSHITKHPYMNKVFCWIECGNTEEVKRFFDTFPHLLNNFYSPNNWNPFLYAVRYGNLDLINYFKEKQMKTKTTGILSSYSVVHTAVYSGEPQILEYVLKNLKISVNPLECESSPLKIAMKANNPRMVEILVAKGAYYVFADVFNNLVKKSSQDDSSKYCTLEHPKDGPQKEIPQQVVVEETIVRDCPIKETLKYARVKSIMAMKLYADKYHSKLNAEHKFSALSRVLVKDEYCHLLLSMAVHRGDSILKSTNPKESGEQIG